MDIQNIKNQFTKKEICYLSMIDKYYKKCPHDMILKMIANIEGTDKISLRILDWFVTRYAKRGIDFTKDGEIFDIHINYKAQLKTFKKRYFDPFRRKNKFVYTFAIENEQKILSTTIGQLNFFNWAISNNIIQHVAASLPQIISIMNLSNKEEKKKKLNKSNKSDNSDSDASDPSSYDETIDDMTLSFD